MGKLTPKEEKLVIWVQAHFRGYMTRKYMRLDKRKTQSQSMKYFTREEASETITASTIIVGIK